MLVAGGGRQRCLPAHGAVSVPLDGRRSGVHSVNVGAGWKHPDGRLSIRGYVNNLFDVTSATFIGSTGGGNIRFYNDQRTAGVTVRVDW